MSSRTTSDGIHLAHQVWGVRENRSDWWRADRDGRRSNWHRSRYAAIEELREIEARERSHERLTRMLGAVL